MVVAISAGFGPLRVVNITMSARTKPTIMSGIARAGMSMPTSRADAVASKKSEAALAIVPSYVILSSIGVNPRADGASKPTGVPCWKDFELRKTGLATESPEVDASHPNEQGLPMIPGPQPTNPLIPTPVYVALLTFM